MKWKRGQVTAPKPVPTVNPRQAKSIAGAPRPVSTANLRSTKSNVNPRQGCPGGSKVNPILVVETEVKKGVDKAPKRGMSKIYFSFDSNVIRMKVGPVLRLILLSNY